MYLTERIKIYLSEMKDLSLKKVLLVKKSFVFFKRVRLQILETKIKKIDKIIFDDVDQYLLINNSEYLKLSERNYELLENPKIIFNVYEIAVSSNLKFSENFKGKLRNNGYAYVYENDSKYGYVSYNYNDFKFPSKITGSVNHFGIINLKTLETGSKTFRKLPSEYIGKVGKDGRMELEINECKNEIDLLSRGDFCIGKLIGNYFNSNQIKTNEFNENISKMLKMMEEFKLSLTSK